MSLPYVLGCCDTEYSHSPLLAVVGEDRCRQESLVPAPVIERECALVQVSKKREKR